jgi:hypothetical protein
VESGVAEEQIRELMEVAENHPSISLGRGVTLPKLVRSLQGILHTIQQKEPRVTS